jgi:hypothetical protein
MPELTLESLDGLTETKTVVRGKHVFVITPPTVDRATAIAILRDDTEYDFAANAEMNEAELRVGRGEQR